MISRERYLKLKEKYGHAASWTVWSPPPANCKLNTKKNISDLSVFDDEERLLAILNPNYVFTGLNAAVHASAENAPAQTKVWPAFHSSGIRRCQDYKLRHALTGTPFCGAFMTDIIKEHAESDSRNVKKYLDVHPDVVRRNIAMFMEKLDLLGRNPLVIALGGMTFSILRTYLPQGIRLASARHYSHCMRLDDYKNSKLC